MSLPPGFLDDLRTRLSIAQVVGRKVTWDQRKSNQAKGDWWAPCPFHHEKTASFHVDDQKGYYYCFGCHEKGDALSFVQKTENLGFMEAVRLLAGEVGMAMPERDPEAQKKADRRTQLSDVCEKATRYFRMQLQAAAGAEARAYLDRRGLDAAAIERWEIGFAPDAWQGLWDHLSGAGVADDLILDAGLAKPSQKGGKPYDTFRGRIMFPIRDARGRAMAFGGRAMDPNDNAKYLNSPQTALFDKGRSLFNHAPARAAAGKGAALIVAEGYMDVIALAQAGFGGAVAPLGTAITEDQLALLWRVSPEPIIALDGDAAGLRAAYRLIDLALPLVQAGQSLRFALMPEGMDPDDLIRAEGASAVQARLDAALPMVDLLWRRETEGKVLDSPERKAALDKALRERIKTIRDPSIRQHYGQAIKDLRWQLFRPGRSKGAPQKTPRQSAARPVPNEEHLREAAILGILAANPSIIDDFAGALEDLDLIGDGHADLRDALLRGEPSKTLDALLQRPHIALVPAVRTPDPTFARQCVAAELATLAAHRGHALELAEAIEDFETGGSDHVVRRLSLSARAVEEAGKPQEGGHDYDLGPNGAQIDRDERSRFDDLLSRISYGKPGSPKP